MNIVANKFVPRPSLSSYLLLAFGYFISVRLSLFLTSSEGIAIIWLPNALVLTTMLYYRGQSYLIFASVVILAEVVGDIKVFQWYESILMGFANVIEVTVAYYLIRKTRMSYEFNQSEDLGKFFLAGPLLGSLSGAVVGAGVVKYFGNSSENFFSVAQVWWFGDALGLLILTPLLLAFLYQKKQPIQSLQWFDILVVIVSISLAVTIALAENGMFGGVFVTPNLFVPLILYLAIRTNLKLTAFAICFVTLGLTFLISFGKNPFGDLSKSLTIINAQEFILVLTITSIGFAVLMTHIRENEKNLESRVAERTQELETLNYKLEQLSVTDSLTAIPNRRFLMDHINQTMLLSKRTNNYGALLYLDLDEFKPVNDLYGHEVGDLLLIEVANRLKASVRETDTVARIGGDEFVVMLTKLKKDKSISESEAMVAAEKIQSTLAKPYVLKIKNKQGLETTIEHHSTACIGVALFIGDEVSQTEILSLADDAMYLAKNAGGNTIRLSSSIASG